MGNRIGKMAYWSPLIFVPILSVLMVISRDARAAFVASLFFATLICVLLNLTRHCFPMKRKVKCLKCDYEKIEKAARYKEMSRV